ncbi:MAG: hypothetical protein ACXVEC_06210 [Nocardioides sp.]
MTTHSTAPSRRRTWHALSYTEKQARLETLRRQQSRTVEVELRRLMHPR